MRSRVAAVIEPSDHHLVRDRRSAASRLLDAGGSAAARVLTAPAAYLLVHGASDVARHCQLLTPHPTTGEVRVVVTPGRGEGEWHFDVGSRDRPGLLAAFTGVLAGRGIDVTQAVVATWEDGAALQAFLISSPTAPSPANLQAEFEASLGRPVMPMPIAGATIEFDDNTSDLYTACVVSAPDRQGLLHDIAVGFAAAGVDVHAARVTTAGGTAVDHFDLSDSRGEKLDEPAKLAVRRGLRGFVPGDAEFTGRARARNTLATETSDSRG